MNSGELLDAAQSQTRDLGGHDLASASHADLSQPNPNPDLAQTSGNTCVSGVNGGAAATVTPLAPKYVSAAKAYVCRDANGLYAMSSLCTHAGCKVTHQSSLFYCPCHGAAFDLNGQNPTSPASSPLEHYEMCVDGAGNVQINTSKTVDASTRV